MTLPFPLLIFEGVDGIGKTTLRLAYQRDRRARGLPELLAVDRLCASAAVYPLLRGHHLSLLEDRIRPWERLLADGDAHYVYCTLPVEQVYARRARIEHPTEWPVTKEIEAFDRWFAGSPLPVHRINMELPPEKLVLLLRGLFEEWE